MKNIINLILVIAVLVITECKVAEGTVINPVEAPAVNKPQTKPRVFRKPKKIMVAVIDTGIDPALMSKPWICKEGHKSFTKSSLDDNHGHGTHIAGLIEQYAKNIILDNSNPMESASKIVELNDDNQVLDFCLVIIKFYDPGMPNNESSKSTLEALQYAMELNVDIINYSAGGDKPSEEEKIVVKKILDKKIKLVVAAGNDGQDLSKEDYFPAKYDSRIYVVGNLVSKQSRIIASTSNHGKLVSYWEEGTSLWSRWRNESFTQLSGTSQATAVKSGKLVREMLQSEQVQLSTEVK